MAKSARASSKKANHTKLRARVFGPAEKLRAERIHAKLLETINQPKPSEQAKTDAAEESKTPTHHSHSAFAHTSTATTEATKDDLSKGSFLTASIPRSLSDTLNKPLDAEEESCELRNLCFHLGLCSDIVGFNNDGHLTLAFDPLPPHWLSENQGLTVTA